MVAGRVLVLNKRGAARRGQAHALQNLIRRPKQQYGRGIAAEPLGDCRALSVPAFFVLEPAFPFRNCLYCSRSLFSGTVVSFNCASISRLPYITRSTVTLFSSFCTI